MKHPFCQAEKVSGAATATKPDAREAMVLLHGSGSSSAIWGPMLKQLSNTYQAVAPDLIGHGAAPPWREKSAFSLEDEARRVNKLVPFERQFHLVGHSYGGAVALRLALDNPLRVKTLTLVEPAFFAALRYAGEGEMLTYFSRMGAQLASALESGNLEAGMRDYIDFWFGAGWWSGLPAQSRDPVVQLAGTVRLALEALFAFDPGASALLPLGARTLIVRGDRSPEAMIRLVDVLHRLMPESTRVVVRGANHFLPITGASELAAALTEHLHAAAKPQTP